MQALFKLSKSVRHAAEQYALEHYPRECVGLVVGINSRQRFVPCTNSSPSNEHFILSAEQYAQAEEMGQILGVIHSHINILPKPSEADLVACEASGVPWHIVAVWQEPGENKRIHSWNAFAPSGYQAPLVGRPFFHGVLDCYTLVKDFYERELNIKLPDFERADNWWDGEDELYLDNFKDVGFVEVQDGPIYGDAILMQYRSKRTNHAGIYLGSETLKTQQIGHSIPNAMLHHAMPMLSERVVYNGYWKDITRMVVRYRSMV